MTGRERLRQGGHLPDGFAGSHRRADGKVQAAAGDLADSDAMIGSGVNRLRHTGGFAPKQQHVVGLIGKVEVRHLGPGGEKDQPPGLALAPRFEGTEVDMPGQGGQFEIVHTSALEIAVREVESGWLDDVDAEPEARRHAQDRAGVAGNIRLVERDTYVSIHVVLRHTGGRGAPATVCQDALRQTAFAVAILTDPRYTALPFKREPTEA